MHILSKVPNLKVKKVVVVGCFDTKADDFAYLLGVFAGKGIEVLTINTGVLGSTDLFRVDFTSEMVAKKGGADLHVLRTNGDRGQALAAMGAGAAQIVVELFQGQKLDGIIGMGGGGGTFLALAAMKTLPFGIPKVCLSTLATKDLSEQIGSKDIILVPSIVDVAGLNSISRIMIEKAVGALCGMMEMNASTSMENKGSIAISVFGNTTRCVDRCSDILKSKAYETMAFHAVGVGGKTMEELARDQCFDAILDITTTELADELCGGICSAGPNRLTAAGEMGIPQVVVPGCLDMVNFGPMDTVPRRYKDRQLFSWAPNVTLMRTNKEENRSLGKSMAAKINAAKGPVTVLLPLGGLSKIGAPGEIFHNPEIDQVLFDTLKEHIKKEVKIIEVDANVDTSVFAEEATRALLDLIAKKVDGLTN